MKTKNLFLILTGEWYDLIDAGIKLEEYRQLTEYWRRRLEGKEFDTITFQLGYRKSRRMVFEFDGLRIGVGNKNWGAKAEAYIIKLGKRIL